MPEERSYSAERAVGDSTNEHRWRSAATNHRAPADQGWGPATSKLGGMENVPVGSIKPHPGNPRRGNVDMIAESLATSGQYKPIVVHDKTRRIIAGTHTWRAARKLGWATIGVEWFTGNDQEAHEVMLADNRASDAGYTDESAAFAILATLPTLDGTGYTAEDLELPEIELDGYGDGAGEPRDGEDGQTPAQDKADPQNGAQPLQLGRHKGKIPGDEYERWRAELPTGKAAAQDTMLMRLGLIEEMAQQAPNRPTITSTAQAPLTDLQPYPGNPRQGDIGLLMRLLQRHGQYRPITVNRRNNRILTGNHLAEAARQLGWATIGVGYVDADDEQEKRILLADNRTADLATYDMEALGQAVAAVGSDGLEGTGFTLGDLDDIIQGKQPKETPRAGGAWIIVGDVKAKVRAGLLTEAGLTPGQELFEAAAMLGLDPEKIILPN